MTTTEPVRPNQGPTSTAAAATAAAVRASILSGSQNPKAECIEKERHHMDGNPEVDAALVTAEESMLEDEEISSYDGSGQPIVDTREVDRRNLTVAIVKSMVETGGAQFSAPHGSHRRKRENSDRSVGSGSVQARKSDTGTSDAEFCKRPKVEADDPSSKADGLDPSVEEHLKTNSSSQPTNTSRPKVKPSVIEAPGRPSTNLVVPMNAPLIKPSPKTLTSNNLVQKLTNPTQTTNAKPTSASGIITQQTVKKLPPPPNVVQAKTYTTKPSSTPRMRLSQSKPITQVTAPRSTGVPNPLQGLSSPSSSSSKKQKLLKPRDQVQLKSARHTVVPPKKYLPSAPSKSVPCPLPPVPCPISHGAAATESAVASATVATRPIPTSAMPPPPAPSMSANIFTAVKDSGPIQQNPSRGRIFSIDIDPEGLDFPEICMEQLTSNPDFAAGVPIAQMPLPPITPSSSIVSQTTTATTNSRTAAPPAPVTSSGFAVGNRSGSAPASAPTAIVGRDRAMSFEFFSFNPDEPLPPTTASLGVAVPDSTMSSSEVRTRPRGDSIIFDPISFQDGGILEEKAFIRSRGNSLDVNASEQGASLNLVPNSAPIPAKFGATPAARVAIAAANPVTGNKGVATTVPVAPTPTPITVTSRSAPTSRSMNAANNNQQMATLPSGLNSTMNHATFQMDLLNKDGRIGIYLPEARKARIAKFHSKRKMRIWRKRIKYDCRKKLADSRPRVKGRFVKRTELTDE